MSDPVEVVGARSPWWVPLAFALCLLETSGCASHLLGCDEQPTPRSREICEALADRREIALGAKSIPYPQWRTKVGASEAIYCELKVSAGDAPELQQMSRRAPQALAFLARDLYELVTPTADFLSRRNDPSQPDYRLKNGCPGTASH
jgi:hypothetical protein